MRELNEREQWFVDRIGKKIWRNNYCECLICQTVYEKGLLIEDREQALYCYDHETDLTVEAHPIRYFDTKKERDAWEQSLPK